MDKDLMYAILTVPIILLISTTVFHGIFSGSQNVFEVAVVNETMGAAPFTGSTDYPAKYGTITCSNSTDNCQNATVQNCTINYNSGLSPASVDTTAGLKAGTVYCSYTAYSKEGYSSYVKTYQGTFSGYNLGSLIPFVLVAMLVVGAVIVGLGV